MASPWREVNLPFLETVVSINDRENLYSNDMLYHRKHFWKEKKPKYWLLDDWRCVHMRYTFDKIC